MLEDDPIAQEGWQDKAELGNQGGGNRAGTRKPMPLGTSTMMM